MPMQLQSLTELVQAAETLEAQGKWSEASRIYEDALAQAPLESMLWYKLGMTLRHSDMPNDALQFIEKATMLSPENAVYEIEKGDILQSLRRLREAVIAYSRALEIDPENATAFTNLSIALHEGGHPSEALANMERAMEFASDDPVVRLNFGTAHMKLGNLDAAAEQYRAAIARNPDYAEAWSNLGYVLQETHAYSEAIDAHQKAIQLSPESPAIHWNYAMTLLLLGDYETGFSEFEYRRFMPDRKPREFEAPEWVGQDLNGKRILIHAEQGLGDTLQFVRFLPQLNAMGAEVILSVHTALAILVDGFEGISTVIGGADTPPQHDYQLPLLSLPYRLKVRLDSLQNQKPYVKVPRNRVISLSGPSESMKVGIIWAGNPRHANDRLRSCPFQAILPLFGIEGITWYSLQVGGNTSEAEMEDAGLINLAPQLEDFGNTAAAIDKLDLVISVDTSVAHLAGAMGKEVWILLPYAPDWRWLIERQDSPWYPSAQLFRQRSPGDWPQVMADVTTRLIIQRG